MKRLALVFILLAGACGHKAPPPGKPDVTPPEIVLTYPKNNDTLGVDTVRPEFEIKDKSPIKTYILILDGRNIVSTSDTDSLFFTTDSLVDSLPHTLSLRASDIWDNWGVSPDVKFFVKKK